MSKTSIEPLDLSIENAEKIYQSIQALVQNISSIENSKLPEMQAGNKVREIEDAIELNKIKLIHFKKKAIEGSDTKFTDRLVDLELLINHPYQDTQFIERFLKDDHSVQGNPSSSPAKSESTSPAKADSPGKLANPEYTRFV